MEPPAATPFRVQVWEAFQTVVFYGPVSAAVFRPAVGDQPRTLLAKNEQQARAYLGWVTALAA